MQPAQGLLFNSVQYALFLGVVVAAYWLLARFLPTSAGTRARQGLILVASYAFYATWDWRFCLILAIVTATNFIVGRQLGAATDPGRRKVLLGIALGITLGLLFVFKYLGFCVDSFESLLNTFGVHADWALDILLPLGISFFTLHAVSYSIDIYRRELEPTDDVVVFALFVAYFPQLLAGPLTRGKRMLPQFSSPPLHADRTRVIAGLELILIGIFQKVAIADALAKVTTPLFDASTATSPGAPHRNFLLLLIGMMASVVQFVLDYAGYSNIARGSSKLLGIELPYNFRQPITRSRNMQDYWRRHNMTLMAWFRDYILRPLRRRNDTALRSSLLLILVFTLSGLWHVASWGWVLWGTFIGVAVALEIQVNRYREADRLARVRAEIETATSSPGAVDVAAVRTSTRPRRTLLTQIGASIYVVGVLGFSMVLFRSATLSAAMNYYGETFSFVWQPLDWDTVLTFLYAVLAVIVIDFREHRMEVCEGQADPPTIPRALTWGVMVVLIVVFSGGVLQPFVYFQF